MRPSLFSSLTPHSQVKEPFSHLSLQLPTAAALAAGSGGGARSEAGAGEGAGGGASTYSLGETEGLGTSTHSLAPRSLAGLLEAHFAVRGGVGWQYKGWRYRRRQGREDHEQCESIGVGLRRKSSLRPV